MAKAKSNSKRLANLVAKTLYLTFAQDAKLKALSAATRVPMQTYYREAIDDLIVKY